MGTDTDCSEYFGLRLSSITDTIQQLMIKLLNSHIPKLRQCSVAGNVSRDFPYTQSVQGDSRNSILTTKRHALKKSFTDNIKSNENIRSHFLFDCSESSGSSFTMSKNASGDARVPDDCFTTSNTEEWQDKCAPLFQNILISSPHTHNSLPRCCLSLPSVHKHPDISFSQSKPLGQPSRSSP
jgi:hypothetical protein